MIHKTTHHADNGAGWRLGLRRVVDPERLDPARRPLAIIPGYGMNTFVIGYHPSGPSMEEFLASAGFEVWVVSLRAMDGAEQLSGGRRDYTMKDAAVTDLGAVVRHITAHTACAAAEVDLVGCSLGGTMAYAHLALVPGSPVGAGVALGAPLRWVKVNPLLKLVFSSTWLARNLKLRDVRRLAGFVLPVLRRFPFLLSIYIHPALVDMDHSDQLVRSVEDPNPTLNEEIVRWIKRGDLLIDGVNVTEALRGMRNPLLVLTGNSDGIVPTDTARFPLQWVASARKDFIEVGDRSRHYAHADLYISHYSQELVFAPLARWLASNYL